MRISYSAIDTFKTCPLKYKYQEIDRIRVPKTPEAVFGTLLHRALRFMFSRDPLYPTLDEVSDFFSENWGALEEKVSWPDERAKGIYHQEGLKILKKFYGQNQPWNFNVLDLESRFEVPLSGGSSGEAHILSGIIDRIDKTDDETYEIIDYKTGRRMPSKEALDNDLQLSIYQMGLVRRWPNLKDKNIRLTLHFLKHGEAISTSRSEKDLKETEKNVLYAIHEIKTSDFPPTPSALCDWCGYKPICPVWKHLYEKDKSPTPGDEEIKEIIAEYFKLKDESKENSSRLKELQARLSDYMRQKNVLRLFGDEGYVSKTVKISPVYDFEKVKAILEPLGKWSEILKADEKKLAALFPTLPLDLQGKIKAASITKTSEILAATRKKINPPPLNFETLKP